MFGLWAGSGCGTLTIHVADEHIHERKKTRSGWNRVGLTLASTIGDDNKTSHGLMTTPTDEAKCHSMTVAPTEVRPCILRSPSPSCSQNQDILVVLPSRILLVVSSPEIPNGSHSWSLTPCRITKEGATAYLHVPTTSAPTRHGPVPTPKQGSIPATDSTFVLFHVF